MSLKRTREQIADAEKSYELHDSVKAQYPSINCNWLIENYWMKRLRLAERIGRGKEESKARQAS